MKKIHTIVLGHGSRNKETVGEFQQTILRYKMLYPEDEVSYAFVEFSSPLLEEAVESLLKKEEIEVLVIVPLFLSIGNHLISHLPKRIEVLEKRFPKVRFQLARHIGADPLICTIIKVRSDEVKYKQG